MIATPHAVAGAFVARFARGPRAALSAGVISHLILDRIPHTDYQLSNRKVLLADLAAATALTAALARRHPLAAAGAFGGVLPDLVIEAEHRTGLRVTLPLHHANHTSVKPPVAVGVLTQLVTVGVLLARLHHRHRRPGAVGPGPDALGHRAGAFASGVQHASVSSAPPRPAPSLT